MTTALGHHRLAKLNAYHVQMLYVQMLRENLSSGTVRLVHAVLSGAMRRAVYWGMVSSSVMERVDAPRLARSEVEVWNPRKYKPSSHKPT